MDRGLYSAKTFGRLRRTTGTHGYWAFMPKPLPQRLHMDDAAVLQLSEADAALGRLAGVGRVLPNPHLLVRPYLLREAIASTRIEGTQASLPQLFEFEAMGGAPGPDLEEVINYTRAMELGLQRLEQLPVSTRLINEMHSVLLDGVRGRDRSPGELRRTQNWIGPSGATIENASFVPPPPSELGDLMSDWERYANARVDVPLLVQCALLHHQFETIHPYLDGNGRLGRLLIVFFLVARGRLTTPILYLSPYFEAHRDEYYERLQHVRERGEVGAWLRFFLRGVEEQANDAVARAERLVDLREQYRRLVLGATRSQASALVDLAFDIPVLTGRLVQARLAVTRPTALNLLQQLADLGVLDEETPGPRRQRRWVAREILDVVVSDQPSSY